MELLTVIAVVVLSIVAWSQLKQKRRKLPPGPYPLPIVGNIFHVSTTNVHESFVELSKKYGPVMSIKLGSVFNVVISSPEATKEVLTKDAFLDRPISQAVHSHDHDKFSIGFLPMANPKWKQLRRICQEQIFATHTLEKSQRLRHDKLHQLMDYLHKCCEAGRVVNMRDAIFTTTLNLMSVTLFSADATDFDSGLTAKLHDIIAGVTIAIGSPNYADYFPLLKYLDPQGMRKKADVEYGKLFGHIKSQIDQRLESRRANPNGPKPDDFLEKIVDISLGSDYNLTLQDFLHLLVDLYLGGSESTVVSTEWVMTELLKHPYKLSKVKDELKNIMGERKMISEGEDISRLPYLQAVIKEVFRLHPPGPFLFPRKAIQDTEINGYFIPKDTHILVNAWGIGRDPSVWPNPEAFEPERFLSKNIDYKGQNFELVPFGSGRRICPGLQIGHRIVHSAVAALIHNFDWTFAAGESDRNGEVLCGGAMRKEAPLMAVPLKP